jgi:hypothetical protein
MIRTTKWSPDTCECVFEYEWDDSQGEGDRTHIFKRAVKLCEHHEALAIEEAYTEVFSENTRKNMVFAEAQGMFPSLTTSDYNWSFDAQRKLKVGFLNIQMDEEEKGELQDIFNSKFGEGKVEII